MNSAEVVNVKVAYIRPEYHDLREWCKDSNNVYIGRRGIVFIDGERYPKKDSIFANPYKIGRDGTREEVISKYKIHLYIKLATGEISKEQILALKGKRLGCWCDDSSTCHGSILVELLNAYEIQL